MGQNCGAAFCQERYKERVSDVEEGFEHLNQMRPKSEMVRRDSVKSIMSYQDEAKNGIDVY